MNAFKILIFIATICLTYSEYVVSGDCEQNAVPGNDSMKWDRAKHNKKPYTSGYLNLTLRQWLWKGVSRDHKPDIPDQHKDDSEARNASSEFTVQRFNYSDSTNDKTFPDESKAINFEFKCPYDSILVGQRAIYNYIDKLDDNDRIPIFVDRVYQNSCQFFVDADNNPIVKIEDSDSEWLPAKSFEGYDIEDQGKHFYFECPEGQFITGHKTEYSHKYKDRLHKFKCASFKAGEKDLTFPKYRNWELFKFYYSLTAWQLAGVTQENANAAGIAQFNTFKDSGDPNLYLSSKPKPNCTKRTAYTILEGADSENYEDNRAVPTVNRQVNDHQMPLVFQCPQDTAIQKIESHWMESSEQPDRKFSYTCCEIAEKQDDPDNFVYQSFEDLIGQDIHETDSSISDYFDPEAEKPCQLPYRRKTKEEHRNILENIVCTMLGSC